MPSSYLNGSLTQQAGLGSQGVTVELGRGDREVT